MSTDASPTADVASDTEVLTARPTAVLPDMGCQVSGNGATFLRSALRHYLAHGVSVFPLCSPAWGPHPHPRWDGARWVRVQCVAVGKHPLVRWAEYRHRLPRWDEVEDWLWRWSDFNLGRPTGAEAGLIVLDADSLDAIREAIARGLPRGPWVITGRGGQFYLAHPGGYVKSLAGVLPGLDSKADGGFVVVPPSLHKNGRRYQLVDGTENLPLPDAPAWWLRAIEETKGGTSRGLGGDVLQVESLTAGVDEGRRDVALFRYACRLRGDGLPIELARGLVANVARKCRPPFDEATAIAKVDWAYTRYQPRSIFSKLPFGVTP